MPTHIGFQQALQILHLNAHPNANPSSPCLNLARSLVTPLIYRASFTYTERAREREKRPALNPSQEEERYSERNTIPHGLVL
jgi:hypothetical protein